MRVNSEKGDFCLAVRTWCLFEIDPIIFSTGRAGLMFHFRNTHFPLIHSQMYDTTRAFSMQAMVSTT